MDYEILINPNYQSHGISYKMLTIMKDIAKSNGISNIALPVRLTLKSQYPLISIEKYTNWKTKIIYRLINLKSSL